MKRDAKFNYGLLIMGIAIPVIADYFLGRACGIVAAIVLAVVAVIFLVSGHTHRDSGDMPLSRKKKMAAFAIIGACIAIALIGLRVVYAREFVAKRAENSAPSTATQHEQAPIAPPIPKEEKPPFKNAHKLGPHETIRTPPQDNSVHIEKGATLEQRSSGDCSPNIIGGQNTVNCDTPPPPLEVRWSVRDGVPSEEFPYSKIIILSSNREYGPVHIAVFADADFETVAPLKVAQMLSNGLIKEGNKKAWWLRFESPSVKPQQPVEIGVQSKTSFNVINVQVIKPPSP